MPGSQRVFIGNLSLEARERDVEKMFKAYGKLGEISIKSGYGFVDFQDHRDADDAVYELDGKQLLGERIRVELAHDRRAKERERARGGGYRGSGRDGGSRGGGGGGRRFSGPSSSRGGDFRRGNPPGRKTNHRVIVENLSSRTSWQDLKDFFRSAGEISYTSAHKARSGEGLVEFADRRGLDYALERLNNTELDGKKIRLYEEKGRGSGGRRSRSASRSRSRSESKSRSRSRSRTRSRSRSSRS